MSTAWTSQIFSRAHEVACARDAGVEQARGSQALLYCRRLATPFPNSGVQ